MNYYALTSLFNGVVVLLVGFYLLFQQRQNNLYKSCAVLSMCVGLWCVFYSFWQVQSSYQDALTYMRLAMMFCYPIPFSFFWFSLKLIHAPLRPWQGISLLGIPLCFMIFSFSSLMIPEMRPVAGFNFWPRPGILMNFYVVIFLGMVLLSYGLLWRGYFAANGFSRRQIQWVMLALLPAWLGGATNWCLWYDIPVPPIAHFFVGVGFLLLFYAIARSRLFDVDVITDLVREAKLSALGIMATSINHEVRNPLFVIRGLAETQLERLREPVEMNREQLAEKTREMLEKTIQQTDRALGIIRNFSDYAKRQSSKVLDKRSLDLKEILEGIVPFIRSELTLDSIQLHLTVPQGTLVFADQHSLEEILLNLIVNACQAIKETSVGGDIHITAKEDASWTVIKIRDTGPGLAPDQLERIFEPFYTTKTSGTGLGLYVVKQLVEKNGGRVEALACNGSGTTFILAFPAS